MPVRSLVAVLAASVGVSVLAPLGCREPAKEGSPTPAASSAFVLPKLSPADATILELLEGLKVGDNLEGIPVVGIGGVNEEGVIPLVLVQDSWGLLVVLAERADTPRPPAHSNNYNVYFQPLGGKRLPSNEQLLDIVSSVAKRLRRTEDKVRSPKGLKPLARPTVPT